MSDALERDNYVVDVFESVVESADDASPYSDRGWMNSYFGGNG